MYAIADITNDNNAQFSDKNLIMCVLSLFYGIKIRPFGLARISI